MESYTTIEQTTVRASDYDAWKYKSLYRITIWSRYEDESAESSEGGYNDFIATLKKYSIHPKHWDGIFWRLWKDEAFSLSEYGTCDGMEIEVEVLPYWA